ncbi:MAG: class II fumarate hydratase [Deltaproteobacteria bacterium]|nr:class II fumarate hydratase [Deltaproteobacteria bacterium]
MKSGDATAGEFRVEKDSMGEMKVPSNAYWGASTQRAVENFPISGIRLSRSMIRSLGLIKGCAATVNKELGLLDDARYVAIAQAAREVEEGKLDEHFVVDVFQTGSGTSSNMNANEVIARRAREISGGDIHPNDHVNMSQSSNDVIPTAIHVAAALDIREKLLPALTELQNALGAKATDFGSIVKTGRTHLMDATPMTLGQEFSGYESQIAHGHKRAQNGLQAILELPLGGTAIGTGINTPPKFSQRVIEEIASRTKLDFFEAANHFEAQAAKDALIELSGDLKTIAVSMSKIANDLRWLGSGPRCGLQEIFLPEVQPGSSIMPAKVNPVIAESVLMIVAQVIGNDAAATVCGHSGGIFELNVMMPVLAHNILQSIHLLSTGAQNFSRRCVVGIQPNLPRLQELAEANITVCTALAPKIGYEQAAKLAKEAYASGKSLRQVALEKNVLPREELDRLLDLMSMTKPGL